MKTTIVIPSRLASTRLPEKALSDIYGTSLIMRVYKQAMKSKLADEVIVATDHMSIFNHVQSSGGQVIMTSIDHQSGTDRVAEVASKIQCDIIINVQGDEPLINPEQIDDLISVFQNQEVLIATQCQEIIEPDTIFDYNVVKVVRDDLDNALYFSRQAIPAVRDKPYLDWHLNARYFKHIGIYGYRKEVVMKLSDLPVTAYEKAESLEQLRWLQHGFRIHCSETKYTSIGVDTQDDLDAVRAHFLKESFR